MDILSLPDSRQAQLWLGGADDGPVVLFFHGCPDTRWAARFADAAARDAGVRLLCVNGPGYGLSSRADANARLRGRRRGSRPRPCSGTARSPRWACPWGWCVRSSVRRTTMPSGRVALGNRRPTCR